MRDIESGRSMRIGLSDASPPTVSRVDATRAGARSTEAFYKVPVDCVFVRSDESAVEPLLRLFMSRKLS